MYHLATGIVSYSGRDVNSKSSTMIRILKAQEFDEDKNVTVRVLPELADRTFNSLEEFNEYRQRYMEETGFRIVAAYEES